MAVILIVDDRPTNRGFLITLLGYRGHCLLEAADGVKALQVARAMRPDLIVSDILMPTMDGYEFVQRLRADPDLAHTPVIFSTAHDLDHEAKALARQCGVSFVLPKPCEADIMLSTIDAALVLAPLPTALPQKEGLIRFRTAAIELIITDILMPEQEGLQTIRELRAECPAIKIIAISGGGAQGALNFLKTVALFGAKCTLRKPFDSEELRQAILTILSVS